MSFGSEIEVVDFNTIATTSQFKKSLLERWRGCGEPKLISMGDLSSSGEAYTTNVSNDCLVNVVKKRNCTLLPFSSISLDRDFSGFDSERFRNNLFFPLIFLCSFQFQLKSSES